jgi:Zn-dependent protease
MTPSREGSFRLFRFAGIDVFLHWSWFLVAWYQISRRAGDYSSIKWNILEYVGLFGMVLLHEFGHSLACRQVGGQADQIVLWPLGGVAYVNPPPRPGATLWSIAAGPLVNVALIPVFALLLSVGRSFDPDVYGLIKTLSLINFGLLIFNLLPIFPLDGGQIFRSLLWFIFGRARSLMIATVFGIVGGIGLMVVAVALRSKFGFLPAIMCVFILVNCWRGWEVARALSRVANAPRHEGFVCPLCKVSPPRGAYWVCGKCRAAFDTFETHAHCPNCGAQFAVTRCVDCGRSSTFEDWLIAPPIPSSRPSPVPPQV